MAARGLKALEQMKKILQVMKTSKGFDKHLLTGTEVVHGDVGRCVLSYKVMQEHLNKHGTLHGGLGASLVDIVSTMALVDGSEDFQMKQLGVSVDMNLTYMNSAKLGEEILVDGRVIKLGKNLAFTECELRKKENDKIVLKGRHTKFVG